MRKQIYSLFLFEKEMIVHFLMQNYIFEFYQRIEDLFFDITIDLAHDYMFLSPHFPIFFILQITLICYVSRINLRNKSWTNNIITTFLMAFTGRILAAFFTKRSPPLFDNEYYIPLFLMVWFLINCSPFDIVYRIINNRFLALVLQFCYGLIQVRETCHGIDIGMRRFRNSAVGAILISFLLSSSESFIWILNNNDVRFFSSKVMMRNIAFSIIYYTFFNNILNYFDFRREEVKILLFVLVSLITLIDCVLFGIRSNKSIDITLLSYLSNVVEYKGNK